MVPAERLTSVPFFQGLPAWAVDRLAEATVEQTLDRDTNVVHQHDQARFVYVLLSGSVQFLIRFEGIDDLLVGTSRDPGTLIGWSVCRVPHRYTASVRCQEPCRFLKVPADVLSEVIDQDPALGCVLLARMAAVLADRLEQARDYLVVGQSPADAENGTATDRRQQGC